ncbi:CoA transferase [Nocardioides sp. LHD-245]|uniref:CaiB/BaiF CoA-transferase family protein n=1 Tax=Nocardioides sp. LHD-245 TaxID=3051387 RepID=UPI0027E0E909|nr:CoA transferase [Nocardioides sp. LHD-245]
MLSDVLVIELGGRLATAYAGRLLRDLGATVALVEPHDGDPRRVDQPAYAEYLHGGKQSVTEPALPRLVERADVVLHDDDPATLALVGTIRAANPAIATVAVSDYGLDGPLAGTPATELTLQAEAGICIVHNTGDRPVVQAGTDLGELAAGAAAAQAVATALLSGDAGAARVAADVSVFEAIVGLLQYPWLFESIEHHPPYPTPQAPVPGIERAADGWVCVVSVTGPQWKDFKALAGVPELEDARFDMLTPRVVLADEVTPLVRRFTERHSVADLVELGAANRVPMAPVATPATMTSLPPYRDRGTFVPQASGHGVRPRPPFRAAALRWAAEPLVDVGADDDPDRLPERRARIPVHAEASGELPLAGLKVLEFGTFQAGPIVTANLAALGAEVIKVEAVNRPDLIRLAGPPLTVDRSWERYASFAAVNLGKREVTVDLATPQGLDIARRLVTEADVVLENFLPRVLDERGLDYDGVRALNPDVLLLRMPSWGLDGPWRDRPGFTYTVNAASGLAELTGYPDGEPLITGTIVDPFAAMIATTVALAAIRHRVQTGTGGQVEIPLCDAAAQLAARSVIEWSATGVAATRSGNRCQGTGPRNIYRCADGGHVAIDAESDRAWQALAGTPLAEDWASDPAVAAAEARAERLAELDGLLAEACGRSRAADVVTTLRAAGVPAAPVETGAGAVDHPQLQARRRIVELDHAVLGRQRYVASPARFTDGPRAVPRGGPPLFGEHSHEILRELGLTAAEIAALEADKLVGDSPFDLPYEGKAATG